MDKVESLAEIVRREVEWYALPGIKSTSYFVTDEKSQLYAVLDVPDSPRMFRSAVVLIARVVDDMVVIEEDLHDKPLWEALVDAGVPREKIVLVYIEENLNVN